MTIKASIVADSINPSGNRLITWLLYYPRCIHAEVMTHRVFSRNSASSRAIPIERMIQNILADPFIPEWWGKAQPGMQAFGEIEDGGYAEIVWRDALDEAIAKAQLLSKLGLHKQVVNRLLEPWMHIEVVLSGTEFKNWFLLRRDEMAEPHIRHLASDMWELYNNSTPVFREPYHASGYAPCIFAGMQVNMEAELGPEDRWHLPFLNEGAYHALWSGDATMMDLIKESVAHAAWVSYGNLEGKSYAQEDVDRVYSRLLGSQPIHSSPAEHVAVACDGPHRHLNLVGWCSWRNFLNGQSGGDYGQPPCDILYV